jgi:hypothetical protein
MLGFAKLVRKCLVVFVSTLMLLTKYIYAEGESVRLAGTKYGNRESVLYSAQEYITLHFRIMTQLHIEAHILHQDPNVPTPHRGSHFTLGS